MLAVLFFIGGRGLMFATKNAERRRRAANIPTPQGEPMPVFYSAIPKSPMRFFSRVIALFLFSLEQAIRAVTSSCGICGEIRLLREFRWKAGIEKS